MPQLVQPSLDQAVSFRIGMAEFAAEGRGGPTDTDTMLGRELREFGDGWHTDAGLLAFVESLRRAADLAVEPPNGWVHCSTYWWVDGPTYLASIRIRHRLTPQLEQIGGHIGYDVAPSARRRGHGTAMLAAALPRAAELGIESALVTCSADNVGSRKIIEANAGKLEDERDGNLRYWVPTGR
ncbi:MAG TPA: GNAT family N-acetyltransferase [Jatrophihabitans sp.]|nr:GNAT family N-acetyltransferase [Jatrophihabitans sp.]